MDRRKFLKLTALTGLAVTAPVGLGYGVRRVRAEAQAYGGPFYVLVNAGGGWDPRFLCDPILNMAQNRAYTEIGTAGNLSFANLPLTLTEYLPATNDYLMSPADFFTKYQNLLCCINGVDMQTNNHDGGSRNAWSGKLEEGHASFGAVVAATKAADQPLAYISAGGYDATEGIIPLTRLGDVNAIRKIAEPNLYNPETPEDGSYHTGATMDRIRAAAMARTERQRASMHLPRSQAAMDELFIARQNDDTLAGLNLPTDLMELPGYELGDLQRTMQQIQLALAAFDAGLAVAVNLNIGGFDTHGSHDRDQTRQIGKYLAAVDFLMEQANAMGLAEQLTVIMASDFARGPEYNGGNQYSGKDHWSVGSVMMMGNGIAGNRVVGATDDNQRAVEHNGTIITPGHIHAELRALAGVEGSPFATQFPVVGENLGLFS